MSLCWIPSTLNRLPRSLPPRQEIRSAPEPPVAASSRSRLTRGSIRMTSRTSRLKLGALSSTCWLKAVPGPIARSCTLARVAVTTIASPPSAAAEASWKSKVVVPWMVRLTSCDRLALVVRRRDGDRVGPAGDQALGAERPLGVGVDGAGGAGAGVGDGDRRIGDRGSVFVGHLAGNTGGDLLGISGNRHGERRRGAKGRKKSHFPNFPQ